MISVSKAVDAVPYHYRPPYLNPTLLYPTVILRRPTLNDRTYLQLGHV